MARRRQPGAAETDPAPGEGYASAADIPSLRRLIEQRDGMRLLLVLKPSMRKEFRELSRKLDKMVKNIDEFYHLLGDRHWVFHGTLRLDWLEPTLNGGEADGLERAVMDHYSNPEWMKPRLMGTQRYASMRPRRPLLDRALDDHLNGRYYAVVLTLLSVMDGFVNDVERARRGLHTRSEDELVAWNSVVGHHMGLRNAHRTFTKSFNTTNDEPISELFRNGIMHGNLTNFDNEVVAAKAWNRLFAVLDWAESIEEGKKPEEQPPTFRELGAKLRATAEMQKHNAAWKPRARSLTDDPSASNEPVVVAASALFEAWQDGNYGGVSSLLHDFSPRGSAAARAGRTRRDFALYHLEAYEIIGMRSEGPAVAHIQALLTINGESHACDTRWLYSTKQGELRAETQDGGSWRTIHTLPDAIAPGARPL